MEPSVINQQLKDKHPIRIEGAELLFPNEYCVRAHFYLPSGSLINKKLITSQCMLDGYPILFLSAYDDEPNYITQYFLIVHGIPNIEIAEDISRRIIVALHWFAINEAKGIIITNTEVSLGYMREKAVRSQFDLSVNSNKFIELINEGILVTSTPLSSKTLSALETYSQAHFVRLEPDLARPFQFMLFLIALKF